MLSFLTNRDVTPKNTVPNISLTSVRAVAVIHPVASRILDTGDIIPHIVFAPIRAICPFTFSFDNIAVLKIT